MPETPNTASRDDLTAAAPNQFAISSTWLIPLAIIAITLLNYLPVLNGDFVMWDDDINVYRNPNVQGWTSEHLTWMFTDVGQAMRYKPLSWFAWSIIYELQGLHPTGYHSANLIFHTANAVMTYFFLLLLVRICRNSKAIECSWQDRLVSGLAALFWALHPWRVETVAWITALPYQQALFFMLASLICYLKAMKSGPGRHRGWYTASISTFTLSVLTYPVVLAFPAVLFCLDWYPLRRLSLAGNHEWRRDLWRNLMEKSPYLAPMLLVAIITLSGRLHGGKLWSKPIGLDEFGLLDRGMQAAYIWGYYLWKHWYPWNLSPLYTQLIEFDPLSSGFLVNLALVVTLTVFLFNRRKQWPGLFVLWLCYLLLLVPALGLTEHPHFPSDRYALIPSLGWSALLALNLVNFKSCRRFFWVSQGLMVLILIGFLTLTLRQIPVWRDTPTLFHHIIQSLGNEPYRHEIYVLLGRYKTQQKEFAEAAGAFSNALAIRPEQAGTRLLLADALRSTGARRQALEVLTRGLEQAPGSVAIRHRVTLLLIEEQRFDESKQQLFHLQPLIGTSSSGLYFYPAESLIKGLANAGKPDAARQLATNALELSKHSGESEWAKKLTEILDRLK